MGAHRASARTPGNRATGPSSSSILSSWLYLARRSERDMEPVLICPQLVATARSAMVASSVSPGVREHTAIGSAGAPLDCVQSQRADLIDLDQHGVGDAALDALGDDLRVGDEQIVADQLDPTAQRLGERAPAIPVVLGHAVLDRRIG